MSKRLLIILALCACFACDVERNLSAGEFTCDSGGLCTGDPRDAGTGEDARPPPDTGMPDAGFQFSLDGLIPDIPECFPFC